MSATIQFAIVSDILVDARKRGFSSMKCSPVSITFNLCPTFFWTVPNANDKHSAVFIVIFCRISHMCTSSAHKLALDVAKAARFQKLFLVSFNITRLYTCTLIRLLVVVLLPMVGYSPTAA